MCQKQGNIFTHVPFELFYIGWNPIVKYSAGNSDYNNVTSLADFYSTDSYTASFPDDIFGADPAQKCDRPYKHSLQKELLGNDDVTQVFRSKKFCPTLRAKSSSCVRSEYLK